MEQKGTDKKQISHILGYKKLTDFNLFMQPEIEDQYTYINFDSRSATPLDANRTKFQAVIIPSGTTVTPPTNSIIIDRSMKTISEIQIQTLFLSNLSTALYSTLTVGSSAGIIGNTFRFIYVRNRTPLLIQIDEFYENAIIAQNTTRPSHYVFKTRQDGPTLSFISHSSLKFEPRLPPPTLTISILDWPSLQPISFPNTLTSYSATFYFGDVYVDLTGTPSSLPADFLIGTNLIIISGYSYQYQFSNSPVRYTLSGFTTGNPVGDAAIISQFNSVHTLTPSRTFSLVYFPSPVDISSVTPLTDIPITITHTIAPYFNINLKITNRSQPIKY